MQRRHDTTTAFVSSSSASASTRHRRRSAVASLAAMLVGMLVASSASATVDIYGVGDGHDGPLVATGQYASAGGASSRLSAAVTAGSTTISITSTSAFPVGRLIMLVRSSGPVPARVVGDSTTIDLNTGDLGRFELARITARTPIAQGVQLTLDQPLDRAWPVDGSQVVAVPEYTTVSVAGGTTLFNEAYQRNSNRADGGIVAFLATSTVTNNGTIGGVAQGFGSAYGSSGVFSNSCNESDPALPFKGEGISSTRRTLRGPGMIGNGGGGGCAAGGGGGGGGVGRGGHGQHPSLTTTGRGGVGSSVTDTIGGALYRLTFGGGGGAGHIASAGMSTLSGGGGGVVFIRALALNGAGTIDVRGQAGDTYSGGGGAGGGGGGTAMVLTSGPVSCGAIRADGGVGGVSSGRSGGHGGGGRIVVQGNPISCSLTVTSGGGTGNVGTAGVVQIVNAQPLVMTLDAPGPITASESTLFSGTATSGSSVHVSVDGVVDATVIASDGRWSSAHNLSAGFHTISVRATFIGRTSATATRQVSAQYRVPETTFVNGPPSLSRSTTNTFDFSSDLSAVTWRCSLDGGAFVACDDPHSVTTGQGNHKLSVVAVNGAGVADATPASYPWAVDSIAPETTLTTTPPAQTTDQTVSFSWTSNEVGSNVCLVDDVLTPCTTPFTIEVPGGVHTFSVAAADVAGNVDATPATFQWETLDDAPLTTITAKPAARNNLASVSLSFTSSIANSTFECSLDGDTFAVCTSPAVYATPTSAAHTFAVRARSPDGLVDATPAAWSWTTDRTAPDTLATSTVAARVRSSAVTFSFTSDETASFTCRLNAGTWLPCPSPRTLTLPLNVTSTIEVRATDTVGNVDDTPLTIVTFVDSVAPETTFTAAPAGTVSGTNFTFQFTANEASTFSCSFNRSAFVACASPTTLPFGEGTNTVRVQAIDTVGNMDPTPAEVSFIVDTTPPPAPTVSAPANGQRFATASITAQGATAAASTVDISVDGVVKGSRTGSWTLPLTGLSDGPHTLSAVARDAVGNTSAATTIAFSVDTTAPIIAFVDAPADGTSRSASFTFAVDADVAGVTCALDDGAPGACSSPYTVTDLQAGAHTLQVTATDLAGNVGTATHSWTIVSLPVAVAAVVSVVEDVPQAITLAATGTGALAWQVVVAPTLGTLSGTAPALVYTPFADAVGADAFSFVVVDSVGTSAPAVVAVDVGAVDDAPVAIDATLATDEDASLELTLAATDVDSAALVFAVVGPAHGVLSGEAPDLVYTPFADFHGTDSFSFTVDDGVSISAPATITVAVAATNDAPAVTAASVSTDEDTAISFAVTATDIDDDVLVWTVTAAPTLGSLSGTGPDFIYTPHVNASGVDVIGFVIGDGTTGIATTATVTVVASNDAPVGLAQTVATDEDAAVAFTLQGTDVDGDALTFTIATPPTKGTLSGTPPALVYTPTANSSGPDSFAFVVADGALTSPPTTVAFVVTPQNDHPFFVPPTPVADDVVSASTATPLTIALQAFDIDGDALELAIVDGPDALDLVDDALTWTPQRADIGAHEVVIAVDDGTVAIEHVFVIDVTLDDEDGDGLSDAWEVTVGLDPDELDTDGDGSDDGTEVGDPDAPTDTDGDGTIDALDTTDDPLAIDTDGDGVADDNDVCPLVADNQQDSNNDGIGDACTPPPPPFVVTLQTQSSWQNGACYNGSVTNNGSAPGLWSGSVVVTGTITSAWNANRIGNGNGSVTFSGVSWNQTAAPGTTNNLFGFCVSF